MLKKAFRLNKKEDFAKVFRLGKPLFYKQLGCKMVPNTLDNDRLGFVFSKKNTKKAVVRNRLRRRLSHYYAAEKRNIFRSSDVVFFTTKKLDKINEKELKEFFKMTQKINT